ncbi:MAG: hypothetical protein K2N60_07460 [Oscillospiraceae bacterium]|nr:hypothetical protein [Oscillospiraceae bacterium]
MEFNESRFYADVGRAIRLHILKSVVSTAFIAFLFSFPMVPVYFFFKMNNIPWVSHIIFAALIVLIFYKEMLRPLKKRDKIIGQFSSMDSDKLSAMDKKYDVMDPEFNTLFLFDEYIYFPDDMLLIPYSEIADAQAEFPRVRLFHFFRVNTGAILNIRCVSGAKHSVRIRDSSGFRDYSTRLLRLLDSASADARNDIDYKDLADKNAVLKVTQSCNRAEAIAKLCGKAFRFDIAKIIFADIIIILAYWWLTDSLAFELGEARYTSFMAVSAAIDAAAVIAMILRSGAKREKMIRRTEKFSVADLETIEQGRALFGTFFMLEDCLWFFWENVSVDYGDIADLSVSCHISNIALLEIGLKSKKTVRVLIRKWFEYMAYHDSFSNDLKEKIKENNFREVM